MKTITVSMDEKVSHSVGNRQGGPWVDHEEVYFIFHSEWRGQACRLTVVARRDCYPRNSEPWRAWHVFGEGSLDAVETENGETRRVGALSDTARSRVSAACEPIARAWLDSDAYVASVPGAYARYIENVFYDVARYGFSSVERALDLYRSELTSDDAERLDAAAEAYAEYRRILTGDSTE